MGIRLLILLALLVATVAYLALRPAPPPATNAGPVDSGLTPAEEKGIRVVQQDLGQRPLEGEEPAEAPELSVRIEVDTGGGKNRLCAYITEAHGYYVESFHILFWWIGEDGTPGKSFPEYFNVYLKANDTLKQCFEVVPAELAKVGGHIGESKNWAARVTQHGRARLKNPNPLPQLKVD